MKCLFPKCFFIVLFLSMLMLSAPQSFAVDRQGRNDDIFYEIFVRSFQDSNGDGIGDLNGITSRLGYLKDLGISGIWLTPIFKSPSYHGYDTTDYKAIHPDYGTLEDFKQLIAQAHGLGIKVVLDIAVNHTSNLHPWFLNATSDTSSPDHDRYVWRRSDPGWPGHSWYPEGEEFYYSYFGPSLPDLNWLDPSTMVSVKDLLQYWAELGVDGFRLDAARYYVEGPQGEPDTQGTHQVIQEFTQSLKKRFQHLFFVGEVWADASTISTYLNSGDQLDLAFNFPVSSGLISSLKGQNALEFQNSLDQTYPSVESQSALAPIIGNHDMVRIASEVNGSLSKTKLAAAALFTLPGTPFMYYGEEIGLLNGVPVGQNIDQEKRTPMSWNHDPNHGFTTPEQTPWWPFSSNNPDMTVAAQELNPSSLLNYYRALIRLRQKEEVLRSGQIKTIQTSDPRVAGYIRYLDHEKVLVLLNFSSDPIPFLSLKLPRHSMGSLQVQTLWGRSQFQVKRARNRFNVFVTGVGPSSSSILKLRY